MDDNYWIKLFSKVMADAYFEFCRRMSSISLAKHSTGTSGDHGRSFSRLLRTLFGLIEGRTDNSHFRYLPRLRPLALAV